MNQKRLPPPERKLRILLCGYGHLGLSLLQGLMECSTDCELVGVFRWSARPEGKRFWDATEEAFQQQVQQYGLNDIQCTGMNTYEFTVILKQLNPDVLLVGSWGEIIKRHLLDYPGLLLINCHPSKLPAHQGANPYSSVLLQQETETGVTFHRMAPKIDAGPILLQRMIPLDAEENGASVRNKCAVAAYEMIKELIARLKAHIILGQPLGEVEQEAALQSYYPQLKMEDGLLDWQQEPAALYLQMRALFPWLACSTYLQGKWHIIFYDPQFITAPDSLRGTEKAPGTILHFQGGKIQIALSDKTQVLEVSAYQFSNGQATWPLWLSHLLAPLLLRPGQRFWNP